MRSPLMTRLGAACALLLCSPSPAQAQQDPLLRGNASKIILVGDSTVAAGSGWGARFCSDHVTYEIACVDLARNGRSTASYRREGSWARALAEARVPGYDKVWILIQFGHNDQPGKPGHSTDLQHEFPANLRRYVEDARTAGAIPILITPLTRRIFKNGVVDNSLGPWADSIRATGAATGAAVVDLNAKSVRIVQALGPALANRFAQAAPPYAMSEAAIGGQTPQPEAGSEAAPASAPGSVRLARPHVSFDYTHLGPEGAAFFARLVTQELAEADPALQHYLILP